MSVVGPTRLILLKSGKYDYGEVELVRPLHLVGPNNVGKTSLIAALQFLYIDDQRHMHFSRDLDETRRYYFPDPNSYILFECLTPTGYRVVGVQGLGPLKRYEFRRFSYQGTFERDDFFDESGRLRPEEEIRGRLADRDYRKLEPHQLRAALTGGGDNNGVHLGLVPTRDSDAYRRFRRVFSNLLRLAHLSQEDLKRFLYEIHESEFKQKSIDLESAYSSQFEKVKRLADEVRALRSVAGDIREALRLAAERDELRGRLAPLYARILAVWEELRAELALTRDKLNRQLEEIEEREERANADYRETEGRLEEMNQELGALKQNLRRHEEESAEFGEYLAELEEAGLANLRARVEELGYQLKNAGREPAARVAARIAGQEKELAAQRSLLAGIGRTAATRLKELRGEDELKQVFRLFNHRLLGLSVGADGLEIRDEKELAARLGALARRMSPEAYEDDAVRVRLTDLDAPSLEEYTDPALIAEKIRLLEEALERDRETIRAAGESERLGREKAALEREWEQRAEKHRRFQAFRENQPRARDWQKEFDRLQRKSVEAREALSRSRDTLRELNNERVAIKGRLTQGRNAEDKYLAELRALPRPDAAWAAGPLPESPGVFEELCALYRADFERQSRCDDELGRRLLVVDSRTYGRIQGESEAGTLALLGEELAALAHKEEAAEKLWAGLAAGLQSSIKNMLGDLDRLRGKVEDLNRRLARVSVSNLRKLRLELDENEQLVPWLKKVVRQEDSPLFASGEETSAAYGCIGEFLRKSGRIELRQLFELKFVVTTADGRERIYPKLESIESNGTTITIKVLINLMLLRGLLDPRKEVSIPYYLDEASSLDQDNARAIVDQSRRLGFTPVLASPEAMDAADHLYFLKDSGGRLVLDACALVRIQREAVDADPAA